MFEASFSLSPEAPVFPTFSEPARSTKFMTDNLSVLVFSVYIIYFNSIIIIVCALEEVAFIRVAPTDLCLLPSSILCSISEKLLTGILIKPSA